MVLCPPTTKKILRRKISSTCFVSYVESQCVNEDMKIEGTFQQKGRGYEKWGNRESECGQIKLYAFIKLAQ